MVIHLDYVFIEILNRINKTNKIVQGFMRLRKLVDQASYA